MDLPISSTKLQAGQHSLPTDRMVVRAASARQAYSYRVYNSDKNLLDTGTCMQLQAVSGSDQRRRAWMPCDRVRPSTKIRQRVRGDDPERHARNSRRLSPEVSAAQCRRDCKPLGISNHRGVGESPPDRKASHCHVPGSRTARVVRVYRSGSCMAGVSASATAPSTVTMPHVSYRMLRRRPLKGR